jgi:mono/diheme cytochrome c family protein
MAFVFQREAIMKNVSKRVLVLTLILYCVTLLLAAGAGAQDGEGEKLFKTICVACHTVGGGKLVGPDLANVQQRRPQEWLIKYIKSSQAVLKSGDPYATQLFEQYNKIIMPDNAYNDAQILSILEYVAANSPQDAPDEGSGVAPAASEPPEVTIENVNSGRALFMGRVRFENGGPTCNSCHNVDRAGVIAGGALAKDVTNAHGTLGWAGVKAIIANAPFPAMSKAFDGTPLTDQEVFDLTAFLQHVDGDDASGRGPHYSLRLLLTGFGGAMLLMGVFGGVWLRGKRRSVNHEIYERQVKSTWEAVGDSERIG